VSSAVTIGRPKKKASERREILIPVRVTTAEFHTLAERAGKLGVSVSTFAYTIVKKWFDQVRS